MGEFLGRGQVWSTIINNRTRHGKRLSPNSLAIDVTTGESLACCLYTLSILTVDPLKRLFMRQLCIISLLFLVSAVSLCQAQSGTAPAEAIAKYQQERAEASKLFAASELKPADELFAKAEAASQAGNLSLAERLVRDARWQLPFKPANLPEHVSRVIGLGRLRHAARINALAYSPDGKVLASASKDGTVRLWDLGNGRQILLYTGHSEKKIGNEDRNPMWVPNVAFSPDGQVVASAGLKDIHVWEAKTGKLLQTLAGHGAGEIRGLAFGADASTVVSGGDDGRVIIWDVKNQKPKVIFPQQPNRVEAVAVNVKLNQIASVNAVGELHVFPLNGGTKATLAIPITDGGQLGLGVAYAGDSGILTCGGDSKAKLTTPPDAAGTAGNTIRSFLGHSDKLNCLAATNDGSLMVTGSKDRTVRVWEVVTGRNLFTFHGHSSDVTAIAIRPDNKQAASACADGSIRLWPLAKADEHRNVSEATAPLWTIATSPDGKRLASAGADRSIRVYDTASGKLIKTLTGHQSAVTTVQFIGTDSLISAAGDKLVKLWNIADGKATDFVGHASAVLTLTTDASDKLLISGSVDRSVRGWDLVTGKALWNWLSPSAVCALAVLKDQTKLLVGLADGQLLLIDISGKETKPLSAIAAHGNGVAAITLHSDGTRLATCGGDGFIRFWTLDKNKLQPAGKIDPPSRAGVTANHKPLTSVAYSPDCKQLIYAGAESLIRIVDAQTFNEVRSLRGHTDWVTSIAFSKDGKTIYSASVDKTVRFFDITPQDSYSTVGHSQAIKSVAVHPEGKLIVTASSDGTAKVWDLSTGQELATLTGSGSPLNTVGFLGKDQVVAGGDDQRIRWWTWSPNRELRSQPLGGSVFSLASQSPDGVVAGAWIRLKEKHAGFELFSKTGNAAVAQISDKGRELSCAYISPDASIAVSGGDDGAARIWNIVKRERIGGDWLLFKTSLADVAITPDKKTLIGIDADGLVVIGDMEKRTTSEPIKALSVGVNGLVISSTGDRFATLGSEGTVKVWNLKGELQRSWKLATVANAAAFTPDGKKLVTGNADSTVFVLELP
jgi:WD40 repeat protein